MRLSVSQPASGSFECVMRARAVRHHGIPPQVRPTLAAQKCILLCVLQPLPRSPRARILYPVLLS